uniref:Replication factor A C-terminal domain-containing protein n=1 Tax=Triticum urartu TaxID=4572 RepID=A0A8R7UTB8_TRIUA
MMEIDKSTQGTLEDQMFYRRITLKELTGIRHDNPTDEDFVFTTIATIDRLQENIQWWYMSCDVCNKTATKESHNYYCKNCDTYPEGLTPRYRIRLQISDRTATTSCTLFDEEAERMLNTSVSFLLDSLDGKSEEVPKIIQELCGQRLIF